MCFYKLLSRKFILAMLFSTASISALFMDKLSGIEFVYAMGSILGLFGASNVGAKFAEKGNADV